MISFGRGIPSFAPLAAFAVGGAVYGASIRQGREQFASAIGGVNAWDVWLSILSDPYFTVYFAAPMLLALAATRARQNADPTVLIRHGSRWAWFLSQAWDAFLTIAGYLIVWCLIGAALSLGLPWATTWSPASMASGPGNQVIGPLTDVSASPIPVLIGQVVLLACAGAVTAAALSCLHVWVNRDWPLVLASSLAFILLVISFQAPWPLPELLRPINYLLAYHAVTATGGVAKFFLAMLLTVAVLGAATYLAERPRLRLGGWSTTAYSACGYAALALVGLASANLRYAEDISTTGDATVATLFGATSEGTSLVSLSFYLIITTGFAYLATVYLTDRLTGRLYYELIRCGSPLRWAARLWAKLAAAVVVLLTSLWAANAVLIQLIGSSPSPARPLAPTGLVLHQYFVNGALQLLVYALACFVAIWASQRLTAGLVVIGVAVATALPTFNPGAWLPSGLSSMGLATEGAGAVWHATAVLTAWLGALLITAYLLLRRRDVAFT